MSCMMAPAVWTMCTAAQAIRDEMRLSQQEIWGDYHRKFSGAQRALLAALLVAGLPPAPELCMIPGGSVARFITGIKVIHGSVRGIPTITVLYRDVDVKCLIVLLELVYQG